MGITIIVGQLRESGHFYFAGKRTFLFSVDTLSLFHA
jgi:hypothetical protein